jgi:dienelactone hydrolase
MQSTVLPFQKQMLMQKKFNIPLRYNAEADKKSWAKMQEFLKRVFAEKS